MFGSQKRGREEHTRATCLCVNTCTYARVCVCVWTLHACVYMCTHACVGGGVCAGAHEHEVCTMCMRSRARVRVYGLGEQRLRTKTKKRGMKGEGGDSPTLQIHILWDPEHPAAQAELTPVTFRCDCIALASLLACSSAAALPASACGLNERRGCPWSCRA